MRILLIGGTGQVGWELTRSLQPLAEVLAVDYPAIDLVDLDATRKLVRDLKPNVILNAAAYTNVDLAESEAHKAFAINAEAPGVLAEESHRLGSVFIHYSTDYVFDGEKGSPYTEQDLPNPLNTYGKSKLMGEQAIQKVGGANLILRTSWVYSLRADNFVKRVLSWARQKETLSIVDDQIGSPTWARFLAEATTFLIGSGRKDIPRYFNEHAGIYHLAGSGSPSRLEWAQRILEFDPHKEEQCIQYLLPAKSKDFPTPAIRPKNSSLDSNKIIQTFGIHIPDWESSLFQVMNKDQY
jgi:dTDP-4-dehydrorhamnose reductase